MKKNRKSKLLSDKTKKIMRLLTLLLIVGLTNIHASMLSQTLELNLKLQNASLKDVLENIESRTSLKFLYREDLIDLNKKVNIDVEKASVEGLMNSLFKGTSINYNIINNNLIVLTPYQKNTVTGKVVDANGNPLPGVNIIEKGTNNGTVTDANGNFSLTVSDDNAVLVFSYIGYLKEEVALAGKTSINVTMIEDIQKLDEIVVVGYGTQTRQNLAGSIAKVNSKAVELKPVTSLESALQGEAPGILVINSGSPGTAPTVRIRGVGSVNFASDPLYVVDGIPISNLNSLDLRDIESISILKDAASGAIYGSRAANGVVLITTKSGKYSEKLRLNIGASYGIQNVRKKLDLLNTEEYIRYGTMLLTNAGLALPYRFTHMDEPIYEGATQTFAQTNTDWQDEMFQTAPIMQINASLSGGNENLKFYTSYGRLSQEGIMIGSGFDRHSFRVNTSGKVNKFLTIGENLNLSYSEMLNQRVQGGRTIIKHMVNIAPYIPVYNPKNLGGFAGPIPADGQDAENPVRIAKLETDKNCNVNIVGNVFAEVSITDWLKFKSSVGVNYEANRRIIRLPMFYEGYNTRTENELTDNRFYFYSPIFTNQLTIDKSIGKHYINAVIVGEQQETKRFVLNAFGKQGTNDISQLAGSYAQSIDGYQEITVLQSYVGRLNYSFDEKYLLNISFRRDGSSVFAPGKKWGNFPGASIGWVVSKENFMKNISAISYLKLRSSYGTLGFNAVGAYPWQAVVYTNTTAVFNNNYSNNIGAYFDKLPNKDLEWEITKMWNVGFDLALLNNSITLSAEYYVRRTDNLIVENPLAPSLGYSVNPPTNIGSMKNWGYDFTAGYNKKFGELQFSVEGNISFINNEVLKLSVGQPTIDREAVTSDYGGYPITRTEAGHPIQSFYGWVVEGIFQSQEEVDASPFQTSKTAPGDLKFKDLNGDNVINEYDRTYIGNYLPDFTYGLNMGLSYKGWNLSMLVQGVYGNEVYNGVKVLTQGMMRLFNSDKKVLNAWTPENRNTDVPRAISGDPNHNARTSTRFVEDGSYLRIKSLTISYNIPKNTISSVLKGALSDLQIYLTGYNLLTLTKYSGYDPEIGASYMYSGGNATLLQGVDFGFYPQPRSIILGINVSF